MRNLREKLSAMASGPRETKPPAAPEALWRRETRIPLAELMGVETSSLTEVLACDPLFRGNRWDPKRLLFLDTETTGLSGGTGTLAFLLGLAWLEEDGLFLQQFMIRGYPQERELLHAYTETRKEHDILVTFNGKSFDIPLLDSRLVMNGMKNEVKDLPHLDLLHACRRVYRMRLGRCTLRTMEETVLEKHREKDLPGSQAPERFFAYLKTGQFEPLLEVARHNREDVISLAQLTGHLCGIYRDPEAIRFPEDRFSIARTLERAGDFTKAAVIYHDLSGTPLSFSAHRQLAEINRRNGESDAAAKEWEAMVLEGCGEPEPYIALAKYYEHTLHDYERAVRFSTECLNLLLNQREMGTGGTDAALRAVRMRIERLRRKQQKSKQTGGQKWDGWPTESE